MGKVIFLLLAFTHQPSPDDVRRFGLPLVKSIDGLGRSSGVRDAWRRTVTYRCEITALAHSYCGYARDCRAVIADAEWRERVWNYLDDIADAGRPDCVRMAAANRLRELLGPVAYYRGVVPEPWPGE